MTLDISCIKLNVTKDLFVILVYNKLCIFIHTFLLHCLVLKNLRNKKDRVLNALVAQVHIAKIIDLPSTGTRVSS